MDHATGEVLELIRREHRTLFEEASSFSVGTEKRAVRSLFLYNTLTEIMKKTILQ